MITIDLTLIELILLLVAWLIGKVIGELVVIGFREWNYRRSRR